MLRAFSVRQQHLCGEFAEFFEREFPRAYEPHLADRGGGLQFMDGVRSFAPAEAHGAFGDRTRADDDDFMAALAETRHLCSPVVDRSDVQTHAVFCRERAADFHHPPARARYGLTCARAQSDASSTALARTAARCAATAFTSSGQPLPVAAEMWNTGPDQPVAVRNASV